MIEWKQIENYNNYFVSNYGKIKNVKTNRILKNGIDKDGYSRVILCKNGKTKNFQVHRLVAQTFIPNPNNYPCVNHKDENKQNNNINNLEWCTHKYNCRYSKSKKIIQLDKNYKIIKIWNGIYEVENELNIPNSNITRCCKKRCKTAGGYIWRYFE